MNLGTGFNSRLMLASWVLLNILYIILNSSKWVRCLMVFNCFVVFGLCFVFVSLYIESEVRLLLGKALIKY